MAECKIFYENLTSVPFSVFITTADDASAPIANSYFYVLIVHKHKHKQRLLIILINFGLSLRPV